MGQPVQVELKQRDWRNSEYSNSIFIYSHSDGYDQDMEEALAKALDWARPHWDDLPYFNRVIIRELTGEGRGTRSVSGFGVGLYSIDGPIITVDSTTNQISKRDSVNSISFEEWIDLYIS